MAQGWPDFNPITAENGKQIIGLAAVHPANPATPPLGKVPSKRLRLETGAQIRRELVKVYRDMKAGEIDVTRGTKLIYALEVLGRAVEREVVERLGERLEAAEQAR